MRKFKAQTSMMEYIMMTFFLMIIIIFIVLMFLGVQFMEISSESGQQKTYRSLSLLKSLSKTNLFTKDNVLEKNSVFYDKKLTLASGMCEDIQKIFGSMWTAEITIIDGSRNPEKWIICQTAVAYKQIMIREVPVSVYVSSTDRIEAALMRVSTYV